MTSWVGDSAETCSAAIPSVSGPETTRRLAPHRPTPSSHRSFCKLEIDFFFMAWAVVEANPRVEKSEFPWLARGAERGELQGRPRACPSPTRCACARPSISGARARARARASENEETLATHPDPRQRKNPDPTQSSRRVTDVTDPTRFQAHTMKLRANRILSVGVLVLLGLVLLSTQVQAESELEPGVKDLNEVELDTLVPDRKLLSTQVQAESELEPEPTRVLQGLPLYPPPDYPGRKLLERVVRWNPITEQWEPHPTGQPNFGPFGPEPWLKGRKLLSTQVQAESENFEPEPTRVLQGEQDPVEDYELPITPYPPGFRRSLLRHRDEPRFCCRAFSAQCLACDAGMSVREFCKKRRNKDISGCEKYHRGHGHSHGGKGKGDKGRGGRGGRWGGRRWWG